LNPDLDPLKSPNAHKALTESGILPEIIMNGMVALFLCVLTTLVATAAEPPNTGREEIERLLNAITHRAALTSIPEMRQPHASADAVLAKPRGFFAPVAAAGWNDTRARSDA